jgi:hypothetical protein
MKPLAWSARGRAGRPGARSRSGPPDPRSGDGSGPRHRADARARHTSGCRPGPRPGPRRTTRRRGSTLHRCARHPRSRYTRSGSDARSSRCSRRSGPPSPGRRSSSGRSPNRSGADARALFRSGPSPARAGSHAWGAGSRAGWRSLRRTPSPGAPARSPRRSRRPRPAADPRSVGGDPAHSPAGRPGGRVGPRVRGPAAPSGDGPPAARRCHRDRRLA